MNPLSIAPMMDRTDRHFRILLRRIARHPLLYTEMVTAHAILHGDRDYLLGFDPLEHPIALQLGSDNPAYLAEAARIAVHDYGYDEINLNVGCPSDRVQKGAFGASLMKRPDDVARCVEAMRAVVDVPVTVKHRTGVDDLDDYPRLVRFVETVASAGCTRFTVHARKAWLKGLSPKENRTIPPLRHAWVHQLKIDLPHLEFETNGGITSLDESAEHLGAVDAVMIGRGAYDNPYLFAQADARFYGDDHAVPDRKTVARSMIPYIEAGLSRGLRLHHMTRHMMNLFNGIPGARAWRRTLSDAVKPTSGPQLIETALNFIDS